MRRTLVGASYIFLDRWLMAKYEVLVDSVIGSGVVKAGAVIEYDGKSEGKPGSHLRLVRDVPGPVATEAVGGGVEGEKLR